MRLQGRCRQILSDSSGALAAIGDWMPWQTVRIERTQQTFLEQCDEQLGKLVHLLEGTQRRSPMDLQVLANRCDMVASQARSQLLRALRASPAEPHSPTAEPG